jgi:uncharacterized protein (DUF2147 family)
MAFRMSGKEWENIKGKSTGDYTVEGDVIKQAEKVANDKTLENELDDEKMRKEQVKAERKKRKEERADRKFAKEHPQSDFAKQYNKAHAKEDKAKKDARKARRKASKWAKKQGKSISRASENISKSLQPGTVPQYTPPDMHIAKSGYTPPNYKYTKGIKQIKTTEGGPYYKPTNIQPTSDKPYYSKSGYQPNEFQPNSYLYSSRRVDYVKSTPVKRTAKRAKKATNTRFSSR